MSILSGRPFKSNFKATSSVSGTEGRAMVGSRVGLFGLLGPFVSQVVEKGACTPQHISLVLNISQTPGGI